LLQLFSGATLAFDAFQVQAGQPSFLLPGVPSPPLVIAAELAVMLVELVIAFGLWRLQRWAWYLLMIRTGAHMGVDLWRYFSGDPLYLSMVVNVAIVFYLNQRETQQAFEPTPKPQETMWTI